MKIYDEPNSEHDEITGYYTYVSGGTKRISLNVPQKLLTHLHLTAGDQVHWIINKNSITLKKRE